MDINWDDTQKLTKAVKEMYNSNIFDKKSTHGVRGQGRERQDVDKLQNVIQQLLPNQEAIQQCASEQPRIQERGEYFLKIG